MIPAKSNSEPKNTSPPSDSRKWIVTALLAFWALSVAGGMFVMDRHDTAPGSQQASPMTWPTAASFPRQDGGWTLVMFVQPLCPCTHASLQELTEIMASTHAHATATAWIDFLPMDANETPLQTTRSWDLVQRIPNAKPHIDNDYTEAGRFHAETSGYLVVYDPAGQLRFSGGITGARGEVGDNAGRNAVIDLMNGGAASLVHHAVFGCALPRTASDLATNTSPQKP